MQHLDEGTIHSWLDGALSAEEAARVEAHVKECGQCQAAVAEARGFIAASSRILTALDNAPRGVMPAAAPKKRVDPIVWRVAATVLVVALGSVVVIRERGTPQTTHETIETADTAPAPAFAPPVTVSANPNSSASAGQNGSKKSRQATQATQAPSVTTQVAAAPSPPPMVGGNLRAPQDLRKAAAAGQVSEPAVPGRFEGAIGRASASAAATMEASVDEQPVRVVGRPRALGEKLTLYEIAPGDTVMLAEQTTMELQSVVVTGAGLAQPRAMAGAAPERARSLAPAQDTQRAAQTQANAPAAPVSSAPTAFAQTPDGVATLTWKDPVSGNVMKLSGLHSRAELEGIRRRIERARAAAADSVKKNR